MATTDEYVARANIEHFRRKLAQETDEAKRKTLLTLLSEEEEARLAVLLNDPPEDNGKGMQG